MFTFIQPFCFHPDLLLSKLTTYGQEHPWLILRKLGYHPWFCDLGLTCGIYHCGGNVENAVEERDNKGTRCHSWKIVFKEMIQLSLMYPPFWCSTLESKKATLILLEGKY